MVEVVVGRDRHDRPALDQRGELSTEIADPVARIHHEVPVAPTDVPDVRFEEDVEVILDEQRDLFGHLFGAEPPLGDREVGHVRSVKNTDEASGRRQWTEVIDAL